MPIIYTNQSSAQFVNKTKKTNRYLESLRKHIKYLKNQADCDDNAELN